jgi:hypothetical protein
MRGKLDRIVAGSQPQNGDESAQADKALDCSDIQAVLFDYMARELGEAQSKLVHEHIRRCPACRAEAAEIEKTMQLLCSAGCEDCDDVHLSEDRRERIMRAVFHPIIDWIDIHHRLVSLVLMVVVLVLTIYILRNYAIFRRIRLEDGVPVNIVRELPPDNCDVWGSVGDE